MSDREKVIKKLEECLSASCRGFRTCPYSDADWGAVREALALLNGQTAQWIWDRPHHFRCSGCNGVVGQRTYLYCPNCGREMLLSETERRKEWPEEVSGCADG